ncbi:MAG: TraR/DksA family transcriptional regulator [Spirochaetota bacterium]
MNEQLKNDLHAQLKQIERDLDSNLKRQEREYQELTNAERVEPMDEAQVRMESHTRGAMRYHDEERLTRVRSALQRFNEGRYGECAACGGEIDEGRLRAKPEAMLCIECERRHEREGAGAP